MHIIITYPIVDLRSILKGSHKIESPKWPVTDIQNNFIRNFGQIKKRKCGGSEIWSAEDVFCDAHNLISFDRSIQEYPFVSKLYSRFYSDGHFLNKLEIGLYCNIFDLHFDFIFADLIKEILKSEITIRSVNFKNQKSTILNAGKLIENSYLISTTKFSEIAKVDKTSIKAGLPITTIVYDGLLEADFHTSKRFCKKVFDTSMGGLNVGLWYSKINITNAEDSKIWMITLPFGSLDVQNKNEFFKRDVRNLRINLSRIHTEQYTIISLLNIIKNNSKLNLLLDESAFKKIAVYLNKVSKKLFKKSRYNIPQERILDLALESNSYSNPGFHTTLEEEISYFEDQYLNENIRRFENLINMGNINTFINSNNNQVNNNSTATNSYNNIAENHGKELVIALELLEKIVTESKNEEAIEHTKELINEFQEKKPKKNYLKLLWKNIVSIVPTIKDIAEITDVISNFF